MDKMRITSSEPKDYLKISGKGLINSLGIIHNVRSKKSKKARYNITNVIIKYILRIIKEFEKLTYKVYVWKRLKHEPSESYFYPSRYLS